MGGKEQDKQGGGTEGCNGQRAVSCRSTIEKRSKEEVRQRRGKEVTRRSAQKQTETVEMVRIHVIPVA